jgi:uncharacterized membrane protein YedE/YeeE
MATLRPAQLGKPLTDQATRPSRGPTEPTPARKPGWGTWLAIVGLGLLTLETALLGLGFAAIASGILGGSSQTFTSIALPIVTAVAIYSLLAIALARGNRIGFVIALLLGLVPVVSWAYLVASANPLSFKLIPLLFAVPSVLVVAGLIASWREFWR